MKMCCPVAVALLAAALLVSPAWAQNPSRRAGPEEPRAAAPERTGTPTRDRNAVPVGSARIRGRVFTAGTSQPVRLAEVRISSQTIRLGRATTTDANGQFDFAELPPGRYTLTASKGGYVTLQLGQRRPFEPGTPVDVVDGQVLGVDFALPRGSVIAGRLTDESGEPVAQASVSAARYEYGVGGRRRLQPAEMLATTDDLGQFRLYGLMPGEYVVSASVSDSAPAVMRRGPLLASASDAQDGYATTFYPGTTNAADALAVHVGLGQEASAYFALFATRMAKVSGVVVDSQGRPAAGGRVTLVSASGVGLTSFIGGGEIRADGAFSLTGLPPGEHLLSARLDRRDGTGSAEMALVPVTVAAGTDLAGLAITTVTGATISGTVSFEGVSRADRRGVVVIPTSVNPQIAPVIGGRPQANGRVGDDGQFQLAGLFGTVVFGISEQSEATWALKSVRWKGQDVTDLPVEFTGTEADAMQIVVTDQLTDVSGAVRDSRGMPQQDFVVVFLPVELRDSVVATRYVRTVRPAQGGQFHLRGLPPGRYVVVAVESLEQGREWDPEFQSYARAVGKSLRLEEGRTQTLDLELPRP